MNWETVLISLLGSVILSIPGVLALIAHRKKTAAEAKKEEAEAKKAEAEAKKAEAETADVISQAWQKLSMEYKAELDRVTITLNAEIDELRAQIKTLQRRVEKFDEVLSGAHRLHGQLKASNIEPVYNPPDRRDFIHEGD